MDYSSMILLSIGQNSTTLIGIWNQWAQKSHIEFYAGSQLPNATKPRVVQTCCQVGIVGSYSHITDLESGSGLFCSTTIQTDSANTAA
ncbi:hypothetical protein TNCV_4677591 [Trichonephila clavipes]|nr:hypothetical protein TNCV_4677591 [Trichonephila clavipes]